MAQAGLDFKQTNGVQDIGWSLKVKKKKMLSSASSP